MDGRAALEMRRAAVEEEIVSERGMLEHLEASIADETPPPTDVADLYRKAGAPLPGLVERKRVCEALRTHLRTQAEYVQVLIAAREEEREALERRLAQMRFALAPTDAVPARSSFFVRP